MAVFTDAPQIDSVGAGKRAILNLPVGPTYHGIIFKLANMGGVGDSFVKADINVLRFRLNTGKTLFEVSGTDLQRINSYKGMTDNASFLRLNFTEHDAKTIADELAGVLDSSAGITSIICEIEIATTAVNPLLTATVHVSTGLAGSQQNPTNLMHISYLERGEVTIGRANVEKEVVLPHGPGAGRWLKRLYLVSPHITKVRVKKNGVEIYTMDTATNNFVETEYQGVPDSAHMTVVDFTATNMTLAEQIWTEDAQDLRIGITSSVAETFSMYEEGLVDYSKF